MNNNELATIDEFEQLCNESVLGNQKIDVKKMADNLIWLSNPGNFTFWPIVYDKNGKASRGAARFVQITNRREYNRVYDAIEDTYKRLNNGGGLRARSVRNVSSVVDDVKNPTGKVRTASDDDVITKEGETITETTIVTNGQDYK